jgi:hypothetical protein
MPSSPIANVAEVIDRLLDKGIIFPQSTEICCPPCNPYILSSVETFGKIVNEGLVELSCCYNATATAEVYLTFLQLADSAGIENCENNNSFSDCFVEIQDILSPEELDRLLDKGIVETGHIGEDGSGGSNLCIFANLVKSAYFLQPPPPPAFSSIAEIIDRILDKGIVIECSNDTLFISSVETYNNFKLGGGSAVPVV